MLAGTEIRADGVATAVKNVLRFLGGQAFFKKASSAAA